MVTVLRFVAKVVMFYTMNLLMIVALHDLNKSNNTKLEGWMLLLLIISSFITQLLILGTAL